MRVAGLWALILVFHLPTRGTNLGHAFRVQSDLHMVIGANPDLTPDHQKVILFQLLRGINYMHLSGVLHRNLKVGRPAAPCCSTQGAPHWPPGAADSLPGCVSAGALRHPECPLSLQAD